MGHRRVRAGRREEERVVQAQRLSKRCIRSADRRGDPGGHIPRAEPEVTPARSGPRPAPSATPPAAVMLAKGIRVAGAPETRARAAAAPHGPRRAWTRARAWAASGPGGLR